MRSVVEKMLIVLLFCLCLSSGIYSVDGQIQNISKDEDLDLEKQLKIINKPPLKTIHTKFGHIFDCVDINNQPAFDHPLLKNHLLQLKPSFEDTTNAYIGDRMSEIGIDRDVMCSSGTVPVRRITKGDLVRSKRLSNFSNILTQELPGQHFAEAFLRNGSNYGVSATISVYKLTVAEGQMSAAYVWVGNGTGDAVNSISAGWQVYPELYGDSRTYFFANWLDKTNNAGCFNLQCPGFVQIDKSIPLCSPLINTSTYEGQQFDISVSLYLDPATKYWWVRVQNIDVGYFPVALFSNLNYAEHGGWAGRTVTTVGSASPPMGSGYLPDNDPTHACYFRQMAFWDQSGKYFYPETSNVGTNADNPICYDVKYYGFVNEEALGCVALFGGPGGNCGD